MSAVPCPSCKTPLAFPDGKGGVFRCPRCKTVIAVPEILAQPPPRPAAHRPPPRAGVTKKNVAGVMLFVTGAVFIILGLIAVAAPHFIVTANEPDPAAAPTPQSRTYTGPGAFERFENDLTQASLDAGPAGAAPQNNANRQLAVVLTTVGVLLDGSGVLFLAAGVLTLAIGNRKRQ